jgi:hypothetical protein
MFRLVFKTACLFVVVLSLAIVCLGGGRGQEPAKPEKTLANKIADFRARGPATTVDAPAAELPSGTITKRTYVGSDGEIIEVWLDRTQNDSSAYSLLTLVKGNQGETVKIAQIGTASIEQAGRISFIKGNAFVDLFGESQNATQEKLVQLANGIAQQLDKGENDIPVLVRHLPNWESAQPHALYAVTFAGLKHLFPKRRVLEAIAFDSGAEAVQADYDAGRLLIIEFNTPQISADNERSVAARINELRSSGEPSNMLPSAYRRIGNYVVFVFGAPSEAVANELIDQVKYQQVVQWLGNDPYAYERATREFTETTLGVFVSVVKASGLALVTCLAVGGFFGALLFSRRRARQRNLETYSDAGGMLRLNLDELTPETDPARLIGPGVR